MRSRSISRMPRSQVLLSPGGVCGVHGRDDRQRVPGARGTSRRRGSGRSGIGRLIFFWNRSGRICGDEGLRVSCWFGIAAVRAARSGAIGSRSTPGPSHQWNGGGRGPQWGPNGRPFGWAPYGWRGGPTYWVWGPSGGAFDYPSPTGEAQWAGGVIRRPKRRRRVRGRAGYIGLDLHIDLDR
jgi:hypothetical protein